MIGILVDSTTGDLMIRDGSLVLGEASEQVIEHALVAARGEYREYPQIGAEVTRRAHGIASRLWCARAKMVCRACGIAVSQIDIDGNTITIR